MTFLLAENYRFDQHLVLAVPFSFTQNLKFFAQKTQPFYQPSMSIVPCL